MKRFIGLLLLLVQPLYLCSKSIPSFTINLKKNDAISSILIGEPTVIPLGSNRFTIGAIDKVIVKDGYVITLDEKQESISVFDSETGKGLLQIKRKGRGPGEYIQLSDVDFYNKKVYVLSPGSRKIIIYDLYGTCLEEIKLDDVFYHLYVTDDSHVWLCGIKGTKKGYSFAQYDISKRKVLQWKDKFKVHSSFRVRGLYSFGGKLDSGFYYSWPFNPTVYLFDKKECKPICNIHVALNDNISQKELDKRTLTELADEYRTRDHLRYLSGIINKNGILNIVANYAVSIQSRITIARSCLIRLNETTGDIVSYDLSGRPPKEYPFLSSGSIVGFTENGLIKAIEARTILRNPEANNLPISKSLSPEDNPVLFIYNFAE